MCVIIKIITIMCVRHYKYCIAYNINKIVNLMCLMMYTFCIWNWLRSYRPSWPSNVIDLSDSRANESLPVRTMDLFWMPQKKKKKWQNRLHRLEILFFISVDISAGRIPSGAHRVIICRTYYVLSNDMIYLLVCLDWCFPKLTE